MHVSKIELSLYMNISNKIFSEKYLINVRTIRVECDADGHKWSSSTRKGHWVN